MSGVVAALADDESTLPCRCETKHSALGRHAPRNAAPAHSHPLPPMLRDLQHPNDVFERSQWFFVRRHTALSLLPQAGALTHDDAQVTKKRLVVGKRMTRTQERAGEIRGDALFDIVANKFSVPLFLERAERYSILIS